MLRAATSIFAGVFCLAPEWGRTTVAAGEAPRNLRKTVEDCRPRRGQTKRRATTPVCSPPSGTSLRLIGNPGFRFAAPGAIAVWPLRGRRPIARYSMLPVRSSLGASLRIVCRFLKSLVLSFKAFTLLESPDCKPAGSHPPWFKKGFSRAPAPCSAQNPDSRFHRH